MCIKTWWIIIFVETCRFIEILSQRQWSVVIIASVGFTLNVMASGK